MEWIKTGEELHGTEGARTARLHRLGGGWAWMVMRGGGSLDHLEARGSADDMATAMAQVAKAMEAPQPPAPTAPEPTPEAPAPHVRTLVEEAQGIIVGIALITGNRAFVVGLRRRTPAGWAHRRTRGGIRRSARRRVRRLSH